LNLVTALATTPIFLRDNLRLLTAFFSALSLLEVSFFASSARSRALRFLLGLLIEITGFGKKLNIVYYS